MSIIFISPTEPKQFHQIGEVSSTPEVYGSDFLIPGAGFFLGVQRKQFPGDFLSSLADGRLHTSLVSLTRADERVLLIEGKPSWTTSGFLNSDYHNFSRTQLRNLLMSVHHELGIHVMWTDSITDSIDALRDLSRWAQKPRHDSIFVRPNNADPYKRRQFSKRDQAVFFLQGFDGIGPELAGRIYDEFKRIPLQLDVTDDELLEVKGFAKGRLAKLKETLK